MFTVTAINIATNRITFKTSNFIKLKKIMVIKIIHKIAIITNIILYDNQLKSLETKSVIHE